MIVHSIKNRKYYNSNTKDHEQSSYNSGNWSNISKKNEIKLQLNMSLKTKETKKMQEN